jgi:SAM-dependent methyltransferase
MTTIPPERSPAPAAEIHKIRQLAESFGADAERYDRTRPSYPGAMIERIVAARPGPGRAVLDVGCGTGTAARQFQAAGCTVLGVEPDKRMAAFARGTGVEVDVARFEDWEAAGRQFDAVVAGTAWHWVDPLAGAAKAARVLRPGGRLALFWHVFQLPPDLADAFTAVYREAVPDSPFQMSAGQMRSALEAYEPILATAAGGIAEAGCFTDQERWPFEWERSYTRVQWLDQMPTQGALTRLPREAAAQVLKGAGAAIDAIGGSFTMRYTTVVVTAVRRLPC